jgi:hypothetical protein
VVTVKLAAVPPILLPFLAIVILFADAFSAMSIKKISSPEEGDPGKVKVIAAAAVLTR